MSLRREKGRKGEGEGEGKLRLPGTYAAIIDENKTPLARFH